MWSNFRQKFGFFECNMKIADCHGINNAFWLVTTDHFEIDICEVHYPGTVRSTLHNNQLAYNTPHSAGFVQKFQDNFSEQYHDFGALWTPNTIIFEVDGEPFAAIDTNNSIQGAADIRFSSAVTEYGGPITAHPENHDMRVRSLRVSSLK
jgi:beta-glucanase (GH16 family)